MVNPSSRGAHLPRGQHGILHVMNNDPTLHEISDEDERPATKGDVQKSQEELAGMMANSFQNGTDDIKALDQRIDTFDQRMERFESSQAAILNVVQSIDRQLQDYKTLPQRVQRLERTVFRS